MSLHSASPLQAAHTQGGKLHAEVCSFAGGPSLAKRAAQVGQEEVRKIWVVFLPPHDACIPMKDVPKQARKKAQEAAEKEEQKRAHEEAAKQAEAEARKPRGLPGITAPGASTSAARGQASSAAELV